LIGEKEIKDGDKGGGEMKGSGRERKMMGDREKDGSDRKRRREDSGR
jgi:hypothetical protein